MVTSIVLDEPVRLDGRADDGGGDAHGLECDDEHKDVASIDYRNDALNSCTIVIVDDRGGLDQRGPAPWCALDDDTSIE